MCIDVDMAFATLELPKKTGQKKIDILTLLYGATSKIKDVDKYIEKLTPIS